MKPVAGVQHRPLSLVRARSHRAARVRHCASAVLGTRPAIAALRRRCTSLQTNTSRPRCCTARSHRARGPRSRIRTRAPIAGAAAAQGVTVLQVVWWRGAPHGLSRGLLSGWPSADRPESNRERRCATTAPPAPCHRRRPDRSHENTARRSGVLPAEATLAEGVPPAGSSCDPGDGREARAMASQDDPGQGSTEAPGPNRASSRTVGRDIVLCT